MIAANADWIVPASHDERRYAVSRVSNQHKQDRAYFAPLYQEIENGGVAAMMFDLLALDLDGWHPREDVPQTAALAEQKFRSLSAEQQWWSSLLRTGELPGPSDPRNKRLAQSEALFDHARRTVPRLKEWSDISLTDVLKKNGCDHEREIRIKGRRAWQFPPLIEARAAWDAKFKTETEWEDAEEWKHLGDPM